MQYIIYFILGLLLLSGGVVLFFLKKSTTQKSINAQAEGATKENAKAELEKLTEELHQAEEKLKSIEIQRIQVSTELNQAQATLSQTNQTLIEMTERAQHYEQDLRAGAREMVKTYEEDLLRIADERVRIQREEKERAAMLSLEKTMAEIGARTAEASAHLEALKSEIEEYNAKQEAINAEIMRQRELQEKVDFYRVCLSDDDISDITELQTAKQKLKKSEILDKIIYDTYVSKPVLEMIKRVLQNSTCSGIYKITCQETKEVYIGKSTDIKNRWQQHCKSAFNCGTIASSLLHRKMQQYGIENFTFELLEAVPKEKLAEREKFYIDFYKTKEYGLNEKKGG